MTYVIASQQRHIEMWARFKGLRREDYRRLTSHWDIPGLTRDAEIVTTGPWWHSPEACRVVTALDGRGYRHRHENLDGLIGAFPDGEGRA